MERNMEVTMKQPLPSPGRTEGDGMENVEDPVSEVANQFKEKASIEGKGNTKKHIARETVRQVKIKNSLGKQLIYHPSDLNEYSSTPPVITGKIVNLIPKRFTHTRKDAVFLGNMKSKEPKFVPYEPYKAAVKPIIPYDKKGKNKERKISRKSDDFKVVLPEVEKLSGSGGSCKEIDNVDGVTTSSEINTQWEIEQKVLEEELRTLKEENGQLESQLKFQAQVNAELKTLLVAAVGEDIETRVHLLTEDKLQLARALLNSAQRVSTHQEQTEYLAGQCEVWRSKFLASSLMVEELAKWKAALCQKVTELQEAMKRLLEERNDVRGALLHSYRNLSVLRENFDPAYMTRSPSRRTELASTNIIDLATGNQRLSEILKLQLLGSIEGKINREPDFTGLDMNTIAEKLAESILLNPNPLLLSGRPDAVCHAVVMGAAVAVGSLGTSPLAMSSCAHCSGEVKLV